MNAPAQQRPERRPQDWIVSVDDHVIEPQDVWTSRLPAKYLGSCPQVREDELGEAWFYEGKRIAISAIVTQAGYGIEDMDPRPLRYDTIRPACYDATARIAAMDEDGVLASLAFPNLPRFCGQEFHEGKDRELSMLCVQAYNDFLTDEWMAVAPERLFPAIILPLWDPRAAAAEIERCAAKGAKSLCFSEHPPSLGLPSIHDKGGYWDPVFATAADCGMPISIHFGSSSRLPMTAPDAPGIITSSLMRWVTATTCVDWLFSDALRRYPTLRLSLAEGGISWFTMAIEAVTHSVEHYKYNDSFAMNSAMQFAKREVPIPAWPHGDLAPIDVFRRNLRACFVAGLGTFAETERTTMQRWGTDIFLPESDFPHHDSTYPNTLAKYDELLGGFPAEDQLRLRQTNAIEWFGLDATALAAVAGSAGAPVS